MSAWHQYCINTLASTSGSFLTYLQFFGHNLSMQRYFSDSKEASEIWFQDRDIEVGIFRFWCSFIAFFSKSPKFYFLLWQNFLLHPMYIFWKHYIFGKLVMSTFQKCCHFLHILPHALSIIFLAFFSSWWISWVLPVQGSFSWYGILCFELYYVLL